MGDSISMLRSGGVVKLPSGRILIRGAAGEAIPRIRKTYLLVARPRISANAFLLLSGYELSGDTAYVLNNVIHRTGVPGAPGGDYLNRYAVPPGRLFNELRLILR